MMRYLILIGIFVFLQQQRGLCQSKFACFENDKNKNLKISVCFDKNERAKSVKYQGQKDSVTLIYSKIKKADNPGGIPAVYWEEVYLEKVNGVITGQYSFTNAGTYQLDVIYIRKRDAKRFYFQVIETSVKDDDFPFQNTPCF